PTSCTEIYTHSLHDALPIWLPDDCVTTPREASSSDNELTALHAPRNLNAPTRCRFSHLKNSVHPAKASSERDAMTGVRRAWPWIDRKSTRLNSSHVKISYAV